MTRFPRNKGTLDWATFDMLDETTQDEAIDDLKANGTLAERQQAKAYLTQKLDEDEARLPPQDRALLQAYAANNKKIQTLEKEHAKLEREIAASFQKSVRSKKNCSIS